MALNAPAIIFCICGESFLLKLVVLSDSVYLLPKYMLPRNRANAGRHKNIIIS